MRRNLAPGCISSDVKLCQKKPLFPFFRGPLFLGPLFFFFFLALQRLARLKCNLEPNCKRIWGSPFCSLTPARSVLDFESFAGRGQMLDGRVLGASQVEYKPFGKPPLKREGCRRRQGRGRGLRVLQRTAGAAYGLARGTGWVLRTRSSGLSRAARTWPCRKSGPPTT